MVCVSDYKLMAVHSFANTKPNLNKLIAGGWEELYEGYSYAFQGGARDGSGNQFHMHGSCMRMFSPVSVVQTNGQEVRWISNSPRSLWFTDYETIRYHELDDGERYWKVGRGGERKAFREQVLGRCAVVKRTASKRRVIYNAAAPPEHGFIELKKLV